MPITKSAKKALRQNKRRKERNVKKKALLKKTIKEFKKLALEKNKEGALKALQNVYKTADKIAKTDTIKKSKASRIKSRAVKFLRKNIEG